MCSGKDKVEGKKWEKERKYKKKKIFIRNERKRKLTKKGLSSCQEARNRKEI